MDGLTRFFLICAGIGGLTTLVRVALQFFGTDHTDTAMSAESHDATDAGFRLLSLHAISYFLLMFGLMGAALHGQSGLGAAIAVPGGMVAGLVTVYIVGKLFKGFTRLQASGTLSNADLVGCTGSVYSRIEAGGSGKVTVNQKQRLRELNAIAKGGVELQSGTLIKVIAENNGIVTVEKLGD